MIGTRGEARGVTAGWGLLVAVLACVGWAWSAATRLPLTGEDYVIFHHLVQGETGAPHLFRPLPDWILGPAHALFGVESGAPYRLLAIALHGANVALLFVLARRLFDSVPAAGLAALVFGLGGMAADALFWTAATNRLLSCLGLLLAMNGLLRLGTGGWRAFFLFAVGFLIQFLSNAEVYGTGILAVVWVLLFHLRSERRSVGLVALATTLAALGLHFFLLQRVPGGAASIVEKGWHGILASFVTRTEAFGLGFGVGEPWTLLGALVGFLVALFVFGGAQAGLFVLGAWAATLVPFVLSDAVGYRFYPTAAPLALLVAGGAFALQRRFLARPRPLAWIVLGFGALVAWFGSSGPRAERLEAWSDALVEIDAIAEPVARLAATDPDRVPVLVNLEASTSGLFVYHFGLPLTQLRSLGFLDAASAYVDPGPDPGGLWYGRRFADYGVIQPELYLAQRPTIEPMRLYARGIQVRTLADARERLADSSVDLTREALIEAGDAVMETLHAGHTVAVGGETLEVVEPLAWNVAERKGTLRVRVRTQRPVVLALQPNDLFHGFYRFSPDQMLYSNVREPRGARLAAKLASDGSELPTFFVNAFGLGTLVPPGDHEIELVAYVVSGEALR